MFCYIFYKKKNIQEKLVAKKYIKSSQMGNLNVFFFIKCILIDSVENYTFIYDVCLFIFLLVTENQFQSIYKI